MCTSCQIPFPGGGQVPVDTKIILSSHNFQETPSDAELDSTLQQMWASGADVAKIATTATNIADCARVLTLLKTSQGNLAELCLFSLKQNSRSVQHAEQDYCVFCLFMQAVYLLF